MTVTREEAMALYDAAVARLVLGLADRGVTCIVLRVDSPDEVRIASPGLGPGAFRHILETAIAGFEEQMPEGRTN